MRAPPSFPGGLSRYFSYEVTENTAAHIAIMIVAPLIMLAGNTDWIFNELGLLDPWVYVGFFENYDLPAWLPGEYKIARLPWIWSGFAAYKLFPPLVANFVIHFFYLVSPPAMTYVILKKYFAPWIAFLSAISLLFFIPFHGPHGWDYNAAGSGFYYLLTFWLVSVAAISRVPLIWMTCAGAAFGATLHANIIFINWTPLLLVQFRILRGYVPLSYVWKLGAAALLGMTGITLLFCSVNYLFGRPFWFHRILVQFILMFLQEPDKQVWWLPWNSGWFLGWDGVPLVLPTVIFVFACWLVLCRFRTGRQSSTLADTMAVCLQWQFIAAAIILLLWQIQGQTSLQPWYMAVPILLPAFLALGGQLHLTVDGSNYSGALIYFAVVAGYVLALMACKFALDIFWKLSVPTLTNSNAVVVSFVLYSVAFAIMWRFGKGVAGFFVFSLLMVFANLIALESRPVYQTEMQSPTERAVLRARYQEDFNDDPSDAYGYHEGCSIRKNVFMATIAANRFLTSLGSDPANIQLWWDDKEHLGRPDNVKCQLLTRHVALPITKTGISRIASPWPVMPTVDDIPDERLKAMTGETSIVVLSSWPDGVQGMIQRLNKLNHGPIGTSWFATDKKQIQTPLFSFSLTVLRRRQE
jgi:hypothetical protein